MAINYESVILKLKKISDHMAEDPKAAAERREKVCAVCKHYSSENKSYASCEYLRNTGYMRPCAPCRCVEMGIFDPGEKKQVRKDLTLRAKNRIFAQ